MCVALLLLGAVVTVFLNPDAYTIGSNEFPGHRPYDAVTSVLAALLAIVLPFYLGSAMFRTAADLRVLLTTLVIAALLYTPLQYIEMALSPQLHRWLYGFHQHSFLQAMRSGGYRPMVFMQHGLAVALFTLLAVMAASGLHKGRAKVGRVPAVWVMVYLLATLVFSNSLGSLLYAFLALPLVLFTSARFQALTATVLAALLLFYPVVKANDLVPLESIEAWAESNFGSERAQSLTFRLKNEIPLLERALERRWFGWGGHCRACYYTSWSEPGSPQTIRDGAWIIRLGDYGIVGFVSAFSLLFFPVLLLFRRVKYIRSASNQRMLGALALMVGVSAFDLIPNGDYSRLAFLLSGALWGCTTGILQEHTRLTVKRKQARLAGARRRAVPA